MTQRKAMTIRCNVCGLVITGAMDAEGVLWADNRRRSDDPPQPGWCMEHVPVNGAKDCKATVTA